MGARDDRPSKGSVCPEGDAAVAAPIARRDERAFTPAKGSDGLASERIQSAPGDLDDKRTRKMEADEFRALLQGEKARGPRAPTIPAANEVMQELVAKTADTAFDEDDLAIPVAPAAPRAQPAKPPALIVPDHRLDTRHASGLAPITKPPPIDEVPRTEAPPHGEATTAAPPHGEATTAAPPLGEAPRSVAPATRSTRMLVLLGLLAVTLGAVIASLLR